MYIFYYTSKTILRNYLKVHEQFKENNELSVHSVEGEKTTEDLKDKFYQLQNTMLRIIEVKT